MRVLFIDNLDSFTFNLVHCLEVGGSEVLVLRNEGEDWPDLSVYMAKCDAWVVGPGPGRPQDYPHLMSAIGRYMGKKPLLGVCLGQQAIANYYGWNVTHGVLPMHGKPSLLSHNLKGLFEGLENPIQVGRYHSLVVQESPESENSGLQIDATCNDAIMAVSDPKNGVWAMQFHPESVLTPQGQLIINQWLKLAAEFQKIL